MPETRPWMFVVWAPYSRRSQVFAQELGATLRCIHYLKFQSPLYAAPKYVLQAVKTWQILFLERPELVFVQNPPFVCGWVVSLYCRITGARFAFDHHSDAFSSRWSWGLPLQRRLARRAVINIVTNQHWADIIESWHARALIIGDLFAGLPAGERYPVAPGFNVAFVQTFAPDEPLEAVLEAVSRLPEVNLYITGDTRRMSRQSLADSPSQVTFTGFLPDSQYVGLLRAVDAVMVLTTRDHTLQLGGCEAVAAGKPLIVSDWPFLRQSFPQGAIYVRNSPEGICRGIWEMQQRQAELQQAMLVLQQDTRQESQAKLAQLRALLAPELCSNRATPSGCSDPDKCQEKDER